MASNPYPDVKRGVWYCKYKPDPAGPWVRVSLGHDPRLKGVRPPKTPPQAVLDRAKGFAEIEYRAKHGLAAAPARARGLAAYLDDYATAFAASHKSGSVRQLRRHLDRFAAFCAERGIASVQAVTRSVCRDYLEHRIASVSHDTLRTEKRYLSPVWSRAVVDDLMAVNPWSRLKVPGKSTRSEPVYWSSAEVGRIAAHASRAWQTDLILLLANTGLRISTALAMRWSWIDWAAGLIRIPASEAAHRDGVKTSYPLALNGVARDILQRRRVTSRAGDDGLVFPNPLKRGGPVPYDSAREAIARAIARAGVKPGTPHDLRHTYARLLSRHAPANVVQSQLGHHAAATTRLYTELSAEDVARELEGFGVGDLTHDADRGTMPPPATPPT
jgi:integrase